MTTPRRTERKPAAQIRARGLESTVRILGIDTALRCTGYGIIDTDGRHHRAVDCGTIRTTPKQPMSECLRRLTGGTWELIESFAPDVAAIEGAFYFRNARTAMTLGMARGAVIAVFAEAAVPIYEYAPRRAKQAVCGYGNANKEQVAMLVGKLLGIDIKSVPDDATDALAIALCHAQTADSAGGLLLPAPL